MKIGKNEWIALGFLFILFSTAAVEKLTKSEIYPSLIFPSFSNAPKTDESADITVSKIYGTTIEGNYIEIVPEQIFKGTYLKHSIYLINNIVKSGKTDTSGNYTENLNLFINKNIERDLKGQLKSVTFLKGTQSFDFRNKRLLPEIKDADSFTVFLN